MKLESTSVLYYQNTLNI